MKIQVKGPKASLDWVLHRVNGHMTYTMTTTRMMIIYQKVAIFRQRELQLLRIS